MTSNANVKHLVMPIALLIASFVAIIAVAPTPRSGFVAAIYPPWWSGARSLLAASDAGSIVALGKLSFVVVIAVDRPDFADRLSRSGAWFIFDPRLFGMCGAPINQRLL